MAHKIRLAIFIFLCLVFIITTPLLLLYAFGYQFDLKNFQLQKTGAIIIETEPKGAIASLNGEKQFDWLKYLFPNKTISTPARIKNLKPGDYQVRLEIPGYQVWEKKMEIKPKETTYLRNITLFKKSTPELLIEINLAKFKNSAFSPNTKFLAILDEGQLIIINTSTGQEQKIPLTKNSLPKLIWSADNSNLLVNNTYLVSANTGQLTEIKTLIKGKPFNLGWDKTGEKIYYQDGNALFYFDLANQQTQPVLTPDLFGAGQKIKNYLADNDLYVVINNNATNETKLLIFNYQKKLLSQQIITDGDYHLFNDSRSVNLYNITEQKNHLVSLMPIINKSSLKKIPSTYNLGYWQKNNLIYANDFELFSFNEKGEKLITRISQPITNLLDQANNYYVFYATEKNLNILELDSRDKNNDWQVVQANKIFNSTFSTNQNDIYLLATINNKTGFYRLTIQ